MKQLKTKTHGRTTTVNKRLNNSLEKLPQSKIQEVLDFVDFLLSRAQTPRKIQKLGDRFAGVWKDSRTAEEIIADIRNSRVNATGRNEL